MAQAEAAQGTLRLERPSDLVQAVWRLLISVRFALFLIGFLALSGLLAVLLPQVPSAMRDNDAAVSAWLELQEGKFGPFTTPMDRVGLFEVFDSPWFKALLVLLVASVTVCTVSRFPPIWRSVTQPAARPPENYFERAANRAEFPSRSTDSDALERALRGRRFKVRRVEDGGATYLLADRFSWATLATFVSHLALILFLAGAVVSQRDGFSASRLIAEGTADPVFPVKHPEQMQIEVVDTSATFDERGVPVDYRTELIIYQGGEEVARGVTTVNNPLSYSGYRFHQAAYSDRGAALRVRDVATGNTIFAEVLALSDLQAAPAVTVRSAAGDVLLDDVIVPTDFLQGGASGTLITVPETQERFWVGLQPDADNTRRLVVYSPEDEEASAVLQAGHSAQVRGLTFTFEEATGLPYAFAPGVPGDADEPLVILAETPEGEPYLTVLGPVAGRPLIVFEGSPVVVAGREYTFEGRREFAGIEVRRDPGANFIWVATGLLLVGLALTFYLPRLRLWARVRGDGAVIVGLAEKSGPFRNEMKALSRRLGVQMRDDRLDRHVAPADD